MKASDLFVKCLEAEGVTQIFGVPGEENAHFMMSLEDSPIEFVLTRHEQGASFMAEVHGRLTGEPGVCLGTLGPGATNLITGVADANMDRAPLICLTGQADSERQHKESHQHMDVVSMFEPVTKWAQAILHPDNIPEIVRKAFKIATTEKPGAAHIELAEDIAQLDAKTIPIPAQRTRRAVPADKVVDQAWELIKSARCPVILAGNGTIRKRASKQLRKFCEQTGIGVVCTFMAKGCVDMDSEHCLYTIGFQRKDHVAHLIDAADVVICLGYDMVEYRPQLWNGSGDKVIVHIDFLAAEVDENYRVAVDVVGDLAHTLWMLNERAANAPVSFDTTHQQVVRREMSAEFAEHKDDDTNGLIRPQKAIWDARQVMGPHDVLLSDVGVHKMWIARYYQCHEPNTCLIPNGFCSMGFALPGAISAQRVFPDRRIMAICGDAGFLMNVQEMETAVRIGSNIVVMIWEDHEYGLIAWKQQNEFGRHTDLSFGNPDFVTLAQSFGWNGYRVEKSVELRSTLEEAFLAEGPSLVVIPIDYRENAIVTQRLGNLQCPI
ncbi:MAG: acetolactate synthase large subunit [Deltaproteobacteria bacterium]|nr:acetolactate synthase large subunit [Deltaproteobacteria bacterium]MBW2692038.1 acetolactate synthase large subunit [Deltaproteobacteria bacterium]